MPKLPTPLRPLLRDGCSEADVRRVWRNIRDRAEPRLVRRPAVGWSLGGLAFAAAFAGIWLLARPRPPVVTGPLELAHGGAPMVLVVEPTEPRRAVRLADGSQIVLEASARLDVLANDGSTFVTALRRGHGTFSVRPGGPRHWVIECGLATVEVVGTEFDIDRSPGRLEVTVSHGVVSVRGERVPERHRRLEAGEQLVVVGDEEQDAAEASSAAGSASVPPLEPPPAGSGMSPTTSVAGREAAAPRPSAPSGLDPHASTSLSAGHRAASQSRDALDELLRRADSAREAGDYATAAELLEKMSRQGGRDPRAAVAALTLARLTMNRAPARAARVLSTALAAGVPRALEEDIWARLVEARSLAGDRGGASRAAAEYEQRFPSGARLSEVRRWISE